MYRDPMQILLVTGSWHLKVSPWRDRLREPRCFFCLTFIAGLWNLLMGILCLLKLGEHSEHRLWTAGEQAEHQRNIQRAGATHKTARDRIGMG